MEQYRDKQLLETIVREIVDHPDDIKVERTVDDMGVLLTLHTHPGDMGKVIGRMGNTAKSLRAIMRSVGMKNNARIHMKVQEPEGGSYTQSPEDTDPGAVRDTGAGGIDL